MKRPRWLRGRRRDRNRELLTKQTEALWHLTRITESLVGSVEKLPAHMPRAHVTMPQLEIPLWFVKLFRDGAVWRYDLGPMLENYGAPWRLQLERHGSRLHVRFADPNGSEHLGLEYQGVDL